jgi:hypothetical protein
MEKYLTLPMFIAFILGVLLSAMVKGLVAQVKSHASGALGG